MDSDTGPTEVFRIGGNVEVVCEHKQEYVDGGYTYGSDRRQWVRKFSIRCGEAGTTPLNNKVLDELARWLAQRHDGTFEIALKAARIVASEEALHG